MKARTCNSVAVVDGLLVVRAELLPATSLIVAGEKMLVSETYKTSISHRTAAGLASCFGPAYVRDISQPSLTRLSISIFDLGITVYRD